MLAEAFRSASESLPFETSLSQLLPIACATPLERGRRDIDQSDVEARLSRHLSNPVAHGARANYSNFPDFAH